ncbi:hypothetical protein PGT21_031479 [Puccinia graminis f. sp. tritici]|uniref:Uncharacterized protein n=1 Tax=Puccinia graminis f. sp. tritici TaxID=56615 RepID=A0A5B0P840_PUCGR|nr:hypothetical protein PGT21_031479 [Puccinia graminis f. sp. tritici]KAA1107946.1 hypothetical protein PGTUg99_014980 [Puccinia graminis f. sp. tritici]
MRFQSKRSAFGVVLYSLGVSRLAITPVLARLEPEESLRMETQLKNYAGPSDATRIRPDDDQELFFRHQIQLAEASRQKADRKREETAAEKKARKTWQLEKRIEWLIKQQESAQVSALGTDLATIYPFASCKVSDSKMLEIWNRLTSKLQEMASEVGQFLFEQDPDPKLKFLKAMFLLRDDLMTHFPKYLRHFKWDLLTIAQMVQFHTGLKISALRINFLISIDTVVPRLESLKTNEFVGYFRKSLDDYKGDEMVIVYLCLKSIVKNFNLITSREEELPEFSEFFLSFSDDKFIKKINHLSGELCLIHFRPGEQTWVENNPIFLQIKTLIDYFNDPPLFDPEAHTKPDFLLVCFFIDFLEDFYQPIMRNFRSNPIYQRSLTKKLGFMKTFLKIYQQNPHNGSHLQREIWSLIQHHQIQHPDEPEMVEWIRKFTLKVIDLTPHQIETMKALPIYTNMWFMKIVD